MSSANGHSRHSTSPSGSVVGEKKTLSDHTPSSKNGDAKKNLAFSVENLISVTLDQNSVVTTENEKLSTTSGTNTAPLIPVPIFASSVSETTAAAAAAAALFSSFGMTIPGCMAAAAAAAANGNAAFSLLNSPASNLLSPPAAVASLPAAPTVPAAAQQRPAAPPDGSPVFGLTSQFSWLPGDRDSPSK